MKLALKIPARFSPRHPRMAVSIESTVLLPDDSSLPVTIQNISEDGFMAQGTDGLCPETRLGIAIPGCGILQARLCWSKDGEIGCQFRRPLDLERLQSRSAHAAKELFRPRIIQGPLI